MAKRADFLKTPVIIGFALSIIALFAIVRVFTPSNKQTLENQAAAATTMYLIPNPFSGFVKQGDTFTVNVDMNTGTNQVTAADVVVTFDPTYLSADSISPGSFLPVVLTPGSIVAGTMKITLGVPPSTPPQGAQGTGTIAVLTFQAQKTGYTQIDISNASRAAALGETGSVVSSVIGTSITIESTTVNKSTVLSVNPQLKAVSMGETFTVNVDMNTGTNQVTAADIIVQVDTAKLTPLSISASNFLPVVLTPGSVVGNEMKITVGVPPQNPPVPANGTGAVAVLTLRANMTSGNTTVTISTASRVAAINEPSSVLLAVNPGTITIGGSTPTGTGAPTYTPTRSKTPTPSKSPTASITNTPVVSISISPTRTPTKTPTPSRTPSITPSLTLTRTPTPTRTPSLTPTATVFIPTSTNTVRPSPTPPALPGDLNRNGIVEIYDYNEMIEDFGKTGEPGFLPADIDLNGRVNVYDYNILVENFGRTL